jgi:hypothetical protein
MPLGVFVAESSEKKPLYHVDAKLIETEYSAMPNLGLPMREEVF